MGELIAIAAPADQEEGTEMMVAAWFKQVGDAVTENEPLLEISTDKVTVEIPAPATGVLREILRTADQPVAAGEVLGRIEAGAAARPTASTAGASADLTPAVRRMLAEQGLSAADITGSGTGGRITVQDVEAHVAGLAVGAARTGAPKPGAPAPGAAGAGAPSGIPGRLVPHSQMRRSIAQHMTRSVAVAPHVTAVFEADLSAVVTHREAHRAAFQKAGVNLTYTAYFVHASVVALKAVPQVNARWHEDALELFEDCNIGIAVALPEGGLILPVIQRAQTLDLRAIALRVQNLTGRARGGTLEPREVQHGTFSISNHGVSGSLVAAPIIIPQPQSAILGVGKLERRPVARLRDGKEVVEVRPMCYVTLTIDHRALDGYQANAFLTRWVQEIESVR